MSTHGINIIKVCSPCLDLCASQWQAPININLHWCKLLINVVFMYRKSVIMTLAVIRRL